MQARRILATVLFAALLLPTRARATVVDAADALRYAGSTVTVEGDVEVARSEPIGLVLELAPVAEKSFRAVLVTALISSLPRSPERIYAGKRVRITGIVQRFQGRPEMVLESSSQIEIVDIAGAPVVTSTTVVAPTTTTTRPAETPAAIPAPPVGVTPPPAAPVAVAPAATPAPAPVAAAPPPSTPVAPPPPPAVEAAPAPPVAEPEEAKPLLTDRLAAAACDRARARWRDVADRAREASGALTRCLDAGRFDCRATAAALAPVLGDLEWAEQQTSDRCD
jgi:hypothetical protein